MTKEDIAGIKAKLGEYTNMFGYPVADYVYTSDQVREILVAFTEFNGDEWGYTVERVDEFLNGAEQ